MKSKLTQLFAILAIIEALIIIDLIANRTRFLVKRNISPITIVESPIALAAKYDAPEKKFEEVVNKNRGWLQYRALGDQSFTILAECAYRKQTNYARILIQNGADVQMALKEINTGDPKGMESVELLQKIQSELKAGYSQDAGTTPQLQTSNR